MIARKVGITEPTVAPVLEDDGQARRVGELLLRFVFHRHAARPHLDGHAAFGLFGVVVLFHVHLSSSHTRNR
jgi:hypothetical protein